MTTSFAYAPKTILNRRERLCCLRRRRRLRRARRGGDRGTCVMRLPVTAVRHSRLAHRRRFITVPLPPSASYRGWRRQWLLFARNATYDRGRENSGYTGYLPGSRPDYIFRGRGGANQFLRDALKKKKKLCCVDGGHRCFRTEQRSLLSSSLTTFWSFWQFFLGPGELRFTY